MTWVFAETGLGWVSSVLEACDSQWETRQLWKEGISLGPSEIFRRQIYVDFWFETVGIEMRDFIGIDQYFVGIRLPSHYFDVSELVGGG